MQLMGAYAASEGYFLSESMVISSSKYHCSAFFHWFTAMCTQACQNGGTCSGPDSCICASGWTGRLCEEGMDSFQCLTLYHTLYYINPTNACKDVCLWQVLSQKHNIKAFSETNAALLELLVYPALEKCLSDGCPTSVRQ